MLTERENPQEKEKKGEKKNKGNKKKERKGGKGGKGGNGNGKGKKKEEKDKKVKLSDEEKAAKKVEREKAKEERQKAKAAKKDMKEDEGKKTKRERKTKKMNQEENAEQRSHHHNHKAEGKNKGEHHHKSGKAENHKNGKKNGKGNKSARAKPEKTKKNEVEKIVGTLTGIASLRREEQVEIFSADDHKMIQSTFTVGPLTLDVTKSSGRGQERSEKSANAKTAVLKGKMKIKVKEDGSAHVKSVVFEKPDQIEVAGNLGNQKRSDNILKQSVRSMRSVAAQRVLKMARFVLKSGATIAQ